MPNVVGLPLDKARAKLERLKIEVRTTGDSDGKVTAQSVAPRRAAAPGTRDHPDGDGNGRLRKREPARP